MHSHLSINYMKTEAGPGRDRWKESEEGGGYELEYVVYLREIVLMKPNIMYNECTCAGEFYVSLTKAKVL